MNNQSLLNTSRPPVFCPGCAHERILHELDLAFGKLGLNGNEIVIVSDIGCSGLFDTFFNTHAFHGLHGRALTYAAGLKMARPELNVIVTMGDGGMGIGGAHLLSACRRNLDMTLLVLNNFNYGMTGGQCSSTSPNHAQLSSGFLNQLEKPLDICQTARAAGAAWVKRSSAYNKELSEEIAHAVEFKGFSIMDIWGICPGRYTKRNKLNPKMIEDDLSKLEPLPGPIPENLRPEYSRAYEKAAKELAPVPSPARIEPQFTSTEKKRQEIVLLGGAGQRIVTAGELLCIAGITAGLHATQKNDYPITVLRGHSISELVLSPEKIGFTGIDKPDIIIALAGEGVNRRKSMFPALTGSTLIIKDKSIEIPETSAEIADIDFKAHNIKKPDWALAALAVMAARKRIITTEMLKAALEIKFKGKVLDASMDIAGTFAESQ
ncbi:2-oxoglutarate synthase, subunit beta [Desulfonema limicola]|uniref:2-oxoglutarate synthase, subunit beta n=1 Tax=Desulfonema limicola TaxID=45656 RepID=A0A975BB22_9BACT|nr:thiamine pyrophosphate-dependent enzyme [Desulfonema limicola]QTA82071.1 2-oxoglutarate synthase, subunit beta [Desulfonema limicola]